MKRCSIAFLLTLAFIFLCSCSPKEAPLEEADVTASPEATPGETEPTDSPVSPELSPEPTAKVPDENINFGYKKELVAIVNGTEVAFQAVKYSAPLAEGAIAPEFEFFFDAEKYDSTVTDYKYRFTPVAEDASPLTFMEIGYVPDVSPTELMPSFIDSYIDFMDVEFMNYSSFGKNAVSSQKIVASNFDQYAEAFLVEAGSGTVYSVFSSTEKNDENIAWFTAMCETVLIK